MRNEERESWGQRSIQINWTGEVNYVDKFLWSSSSEFPFPRLCSSSSPVRSVRLRPLALSSFRSTGDQVLHWTDNQVTRVYKVKTIFKQLHFKVRRNVFIHWHHPHMMHHSRFPWKHHSVRFGVIARLIINKVVWSLTRFNMDPLEQRDTNLCQNNLNSTMAPPSGDASSLVLPAVRRVATRRRS